MTPIRVVSLGLGPIGRRAASLAASKVGLDLVGAVDIAPDIVGQDLCDVLEGGGPSGVSVSDDLAGTLASCKPDVVIHCTSSFMPAVESQLLAVCEGGANLISSTEEMLWPRLQHPEIADRVDAAARSAGVTVLGTGVNPGFVMDVLPAFASSVCYDVEHVFCRRWVDATTRRLPFQKKIGAGMQESQFRELAAAGKLGHIGLPESIALLGAACGWALDQVEQDVQPIIAERDLETPYLRVAKGEVAGIHNTGFGALDGEKLVEMDLRMFVGCEEPHDEAVLRSNPPMHVRIEGGTSGDFATAAMLVNGIAGVVAARPGLVTMLDVPVPHLAR